MVDENDQFMKKQKSRLEKLAKEVDAAKMEVENLKATNEDLKQQLREIQIQMKKLVKWEKFGRTYFVLFYACWYLGCCIKCISLNLFVSV